MTLTPTPDVVLDAVRALVQAGSPAGFQIYRGFETEADHGDSQYGLVHIASVDRSLGEDLPDGSRRGYVTALVTADWFNDGAMHAAASFRAWSTSRRGRDVMRRYRMFATNTSSVVNLTDRVARGYQQRAQVTIDMTYTERLTDAIPTADVVEVDLHESPTVTREITITR